MNDLPMPPLYDELAPWWPLLSAPADYEEEAGAYAEILLAATGTTDPTLLELGSGGGNNAVHMKSRFSRVVLTDRAPAMLDVSRALNPDCEHHVGDMCSIRLDRTFDCVFVHDAVSYLTTRDQVRRLAETLRVHCRAGGAVAIVPDHLRETFRPSTSHGGHDAADGRGLRYLAWTSDPDPDDETVVTDYALLLRGADGGVTVRHDRHVEGLFPERLWLDLLAEGGFDTRVVDFRHSECDEPIRVFTGVRR